jgi:hypothetical protein
VASFDFYCRFFSQHYMLLYGNYSLAQAAIHVSVLTLISGFHRDVDEMCGLLGYYAALCGNCLPTFS